MQNSRSLLTALGLLVIVAPAVFSADADSKVETFDVAPAGQWLACTISPRGVHAAVLVKKEAQRVVLLDGVEGPAFDELLPFDGRSLNVSRPLDTGTRIPVVFSDDGEHHAYLAKVNDDYVAIRDGREIARGKFGSKLTSLRFSSGGSHLYYIESNPALGTWLFMDGKPETPLQEAPKVVFSPDGKRYAYVARKKGQPKPSLFVDGQEASYFGEDPQFTSDSKTLITVARTAPNNHSVLAEGKPLLRTKYVFKVYVSPVGNQIVSVVHTERGSSHRLMLFDKDVPDSECGKIRNVFFSPDGKRFAALCSNHGYTQNLRQVNQGEFIFVDGKRGTVYQHIRDAAETSQDRERQMWISGGHLRPDNPTFVVPGFTPDSSKFIYMPWSGSQEYVVVNEQASEPYPLGRLRSPVVGGRGQRVAYLFQDPVRKIVVDGQARDLTHQPHSLAFSPDGTRCAYVHANVWLDGADLPIYTRPSRYLFSPDSKHFVVVGQSTGTPPTRGLFIGGDLVLTHVEGIERPVFTPDSQHLLWIGRGNAQSNQDSLMAYVDGRPTVAFRELINTRDNWEMSRDGVLSFVARTGDALKRFRVTPSASSGVKAMIAVAQAGGPASVPAGPLPVAQATAAPVADFAPAAESANSAAAPRPALNNDPAAPATDAPTPPAAPVATLPGPIGDTARKVDQTTSEIEKTKAELQKAKGQLKSLWETLAPKKQ